MLLNRKRQSNRTVDHCLSAWLCSFYASGLSGWNYLLERLDGAVGESWQCGCEVFANGQAEPAAAFYDGEDRSHFRPSLCAASMDPVLATDRDGPHGFLSEIV
jgi:hypothetical protein